MNFRHTLTAFVAALFVLPAGAADPIAGTAYGVDARLIGTSGWTRICLEFNENGELGIQYSALDMLWSRSDADPGRVVAVTRPKQLTLVPYQLGLHAEQIADSVIGGTTLDGRGNAVVFFGTPIASCSGAEAAPAVTTALADYTAAAGTYGAGPSEMDVAYAASKVRGRSFSITTTDDTGRTSAHCMRFGDAGDAARDNRIDMVWAPDFGGDLRFDFQATGLGEHVYGSLIDSGLIELHGIDVRSGKTVRYYGFGEEVKGCFSAPL